MKNIFVLGSLNTDLTINTKVFPKEGETVAGYGFKTAYGGKGLNQAIAAAKLGANVKFLGSVGNDDYGKKLVNLLKEWNIDVTDIKISEVSSSGTAVIILNNSNNRIVLDLGANLEIKKDDINAFLKKANIGDIFVCQLENNIDATEYALCAAKEKGLITVLNPAPANIEIAKSLKYVDYFVPNETEFNLLKDHLNIDTNLIITKGKDGYTFISKNTEFSSPAPKVKVVDTVGAGDTFVGALAYILASEKPVNKENLDFVSKVASISTTKTGSSSSSPTLKEVLNYKW